MYLACIEEGVGVSPHNDVNVWDRLRHFDIWAIAHMHNEGKIPGFLAVAWFCDFGQPSNSTTSEFGQTCIPTHARLGVERQGGGALLGVTRWTIRLIDSKAICRRLKNWHVKALCGRCLSVWGPEPHTTPSCALCIFIYTGKGRRGESWTREKVRGATVHEAGSKILPWLIVSPVYKLW